MFLRYLHFSSDFFGSIGKQLDKKAKVNFKVYDVIDRETNNYNTYIAQYSRSKGNQIMKFGQLTEYNMRNIFIEKACTKCGGKASLRPS